MNGDLGLAEILVVDDNLADVELILEALRSCNLANHVHVVNDGAEALDYVFSAGKYFSRSPSLNPRVILLDLKLPKVDGMEVLRRIRSDERTKLVPVVVLTSSTVERDVVEAYGLGLNSYVVKPVRFELFVQAVADLGLYWALLNQPPA
jgi:two-component system, response regulator